MLRSGEEEFSARGGRHYTCRQHAQARGKSDKQKWRKDVNGDW